MSEIEKTGASVPPQAAMTPLGPPAQTNVGQRGLYLALGFLLTSAVVGAAAAETPTFFKARADQSGTPQTASQQASATSATDSGQTDTGQTTSIRPAPVEANTQAQPVQPPGGPSAEAQESFRAQMRELQEQMEEVNVRVKTATSGLISIKSDMASQGLSLRWDVLEAEARMNQLIGKAQREISSGDAVSAEQDLQMAGYSIDFIEGFLGR